jgi:hypothetical protein
MSVRPSRRDQLQRHASVLLAVALFGTSMLVARSFATPGGEGRGPAGPSGPAPSIVTTAYSGPDLIGVFTGCNPECDLEVAMEGIGRRLTFTDRAIDESAPSLSPDLTQAAYRCAEPGVEPGGAESPGPAGLGSICLIGMLGTEHDATPPPSTTLLSTPGVDYGAPAWSPDGSVIVVEIHAADGSTGLAYVDPGTAEMTTVSTDVGDVSSPAWSADGSMLGFACGTATGEQAASTRFCTMPRDGGEVTALGSVDGECGTPAFMPDGAHMAVVCVVPGAQGGDLFVLALDEPFTHSFTMSQLIAPEGIRRVVFSPEQHYAFVRRDDALWAIGLPEGAWSLPPLPPLHGDFDLRVMVQ